MKKFRYLIDCRYINVIEIIIYNHFVFITYIIFIPWHVWLGEYLIHEELRRMIFVIHASWLFLLLGDIHDFKSHIQYMIMKKNQLYMIYLIFIFLI